MNFRSLIKKLIPRRLFQAVEPFGHKIEAIIQNLIHGFPARKLKIIGVTGTDGKTTTAMLIAQMLRNSGYKVAVLTTVSVDFGDGQGERPSPDHMTTASAGKLLKMLKQIAAHQPDWVVLETSSHALAQHRVWGVPYSLAVMTNVSHEHLDYHKTFQRYVAAKARLFKLASRNKKGLRAGVINYDDPSCQEFIKASHKYLTYGLKGGDLKAVDIKSSTKGNEFTVLADGQNYQITSSLPGQFNVYNALAAVGVGKLIGLDKLQIEQGIASLEQVAGRMMLVRDINQPFSVYIDYAVTPKALESALQACQAVSEGKVSIVFGATGDRDKTKRPVMGEIVTKHADRIYLTDDETYTENPAAIRRAVMQGIVKAGGDSKTKEFDDRGQAIQQALKDAKPGDVILISGLGHQTTRNMDGQDQPWSDRKEVQKVFK